MVVVVSGNGLGLFGTSASTQGANGNASLGRGGERVFVNTATGNLVIQNFDETLSARNLALARGGGRGRQCARGLVSFPVTVRVVDYEEYYRIDDQQFEKFKTNSDAALAFVTRCRARKLDGLLFIKPGLNRGTPI